LKKLFIFFAGQGRKARASESKKLNRKRDYERVVSVFSSIKSLKSQTIANLKGENQMQQKTQKELRQLYVDILSRDIWPNDQKMIDFCLKQTAYIVELKTGEIIAIEKPAIQKDFCFGYSDSRYNTEDYDRANEKVHHARTSADYFMTENLSDINSMIEILNTKNLSHFDYYVSTPFSNQPKNSKLKGIYKCSNYDERNQGVKLEGEDRRRVIDAYVTVRADFVKRLERYLKRYGLSKIHAWSYWRDA